MADEPQPDTGNPMLEKAGAVVTLLAGLALIAIAIDTLRPKREDQAPDED
jgi:hypothetical protein